MKSTTMILPLHSHCPKVVVTKVNGTIPLMPQLFMPTTCHFYFWKDLNEESIDTTAVPIWSELQIPKYRLYCEVRVTCLLREKGENKYVDIMIGDTKMVIQVSKRSAEIVWQSSKKRWQQSVWDMRNMSENEDNKRCNKMWGQYTVVQSKGELSVVFGSVGDKKHKYNYNNRMKCKTSVKHKANWPKIIPEKLKLWCTNHVKRVWWNTPEKVTQ